MIKNDTLCTVELSETELEELLNLVRSRWHTYYGWFPRYEDKWEMTPVTDDELAVLNMMMNKFVGALTEEGQDNA